MHVALTLRDFIDRAELVHGDRVAVIDEPDPPGGPLGPLTYRQLAAMARGQAARLDELGIGPGERVAILSPNAARFLVALFGVSAYGRIVVPINFRLNAAEIAYILEHSGARVLLMDADSEAQAAGAGVEHRFVLGTATDAEVFGDGDGPSPPRADLDESAVASINYTSGTTARPKGVCLTHRSLWLNAATFGWHVGISERDQYLHTLPMFHCNGWGLPYALTAMGAPQVVLRKVDGEEILARIEANGVSLLAGAPAVVAAVLDAATTRREVGRAVPGGVRMVVAGAPPPSKAIERVETELGWEFIQIYGLTETSPLLTMNRNRQEYDALPAAERAARLGRAGAPAIGVTLAVDDQGEVLARSNVVLEGYWDQPEATAEALRDGWFHTGDGGFLDEEHHLTISDRKKDVIISGGENVSSIEVEDAVFAHPAVAEVAVIGVPDARWGETVKALVVLAPEAEATEAEIIAHCREHLAHYKCPTSVELRDELARTATGKLQKFKLRAPYWEGLERQVN